MTRSAYDSEFDAYRIGTAERWLRRARAARTSAERARAALREAEEAATAVKGLSYERIGGAQMENGDDTMAAKVARIEAARDRYAEQLAEYLEHVEHVDRVLARLEDHRHAQLLRLRYLDDKPWCDVERAMSYSERMVQYLSRDALLALFELIPEGRIPDAMD